MKKFKLLFILLVLISCKEENTESDDVLGYFSYLNPKVYYDNYRIQLDSLEKIRIEEYFNFHKAEYKEYQYVFEWFNSNPPQLGSLSGDFYKIISGVIQDGNNIKRVDFRNQSSNNSYRYFFKTDNFFFIFELELIDTAVKCVNVRRIGNGYGKEPMYDLVYDDRGSLIEEVFQSDVNPDFFEKNGEYFFVFSKKSNGKKIVNTINLGKSSR